MMSGVIRLYGLLFLVDLVLVVIALIDCLSTEEFAVRNLPKLAWVFIILLFPPIGPIVWFVAGRPQRQRVGRAGDWRPGSGFPAPARSAPTTTPSFCGARPVTGGRTRSCCASGRRTCAGAKRSCATATATADEAVTSADVGRVGIAADPALPSTQSDRSGLGSGCRS
jgi:hypothetical protein